MYDISYDNIDMLYHYYRDLIAIFCHIIFIVKIKLKCSNNANNTCVCDYIDWKVHISIITVW